MASSTDTVTPKYKYGIFFPEHTGYLYVRKLTPGNEGDVTLVHSIADGMQCVRKKTHPQDREGPESKIAEVEFYRPHPSIPSLIWSQDHKVLNIDHEDYDTLKSTVMISKYCNGGTLNTFAWYFLCNRNGPRVPEVLLWRMLDQRLQTLLYLHNSQPGITHLDNHLNNVFLHYEEGAKLPDFYTGDLGHAMPIDPAVWEETTTDASMDSPGFRKMKDLELPNRNWFDKPPRAPYNETVRSMSIDVTNIWFGLVMLMYRIDLEEVNPYDLDMRDESMNRQEWSPELFECELTLGKITEFFNSDQKTTRYNELEALSVEISRMAALSAAADPNADVRFVLADLKTTNHEDEDEDEDDPPKGQLLQAYRTAHSQSGRPATFNSRIPLLELAKQWPEPWRIARIEEDTGRVLGVEKMTYTFNAPKIKDCRSKGAGSRLPHLATPRSDKIGLKQILAAATVADTVTHLIDEEDFSLAAFVREDGDNLNDDEIFGLDPEWTEERLAGPPFYRQVRGTNRGR